MPGSRLSQDDRKHIAAGLAAGLGYAEIARRLRRPTSTISREVARNGGYRGYRADQAHHNTELRAHRPKTATAQVVSFTAEAYGRDHEAVRDFETRFTTIMTQTGLPPMTARVLGCLLTSDAGSLTATELVQRLRVSPASISKAVAYLEPLGLLRRERDPRRRRERYVLDDDVWYRASAQEVRVCDLWADAARQGVEVLGAATPAGIRLADMSRFFEFVARDMASAAEHWRQVFSAQRRTRAQDGGT